MKPRRGMAVVTVDEFDRSDDPAGALAQGVQVEHGGDLGPVSQRWRVCATFSLRAGDLTPVDGLAGVDEESSARFVGPTTVLDILDNRARSGWPTAA